MSLAFEHSPRIEADPLQTDGGRALFIVDARLGILQYDGGGGRLIAMELVERHSLRSCGAAFARRVQHWISAQGGNGAGAELRTHVALADGYDREATVVRLTGRPEPVGHGGIYAIALREPHRAMCRDFEIVSRECGLTSGEARTLRHLLEGRDTVATAQRIGVAPSTVRTHLQRIFAKTGTTRQSELVRFVATFIPHRKGDGP